MRKTAQIFAFFWLIISSLVLPIPAHAQAKTVLAVIVSTNADDNIKQPFTPSTLKRIFWRKKLYWPGGHRIHPANLQAEHPLRLLFSKSVLHSLPKNQVSYWNGLYFHGTRPPHSLQSEEAMIRYVAETKGAIGYIDACQLDKRVKPVLWVVNGKVIAKQPARLACDIAH